jgi:predicted transcriptional regulator
VQTLLSRLQAKGYAVSDKSGVAHVFHAAVTRDDLIQQRLVDLADRLCEGTASPLVHALVGGHRFTAEEIEEFRKLLDKAEVRQRRGASRGKK